MSPMDENQLRRPISLLLFSLLGPTSSQVPYHYAPVCTRRCQQIHRGWTEFDLVNFITMLSETEQLGLHVASVPDGHAPISRPRQHQTRIKGRVVHRHYLRYVRFNALRRHLLSQVPNLELLIVTDWGELIEVKVIPADVLNNLGVSIRHTKEWIDLLWQLILVLDVPNIDLVVITARQQIAFLSLVPVESITLFVVT